MSYIIQFFKELIASHIDPNVVATYLKNACWCEWVCPTDDARVFEPRTSDGIRHTVRIPMSMDEQGFKTSMLHVIERIAMVEHRPLDQVLIQLRNGNSTYYGAC